MNILFDVASILAVFATLLSVSVILFLLGAPFIAALEVIIYAGAIMVLFVFVVMMLNLGKVSEKTESGLLNLKMWFGPIIISLILLAEMVYVLLNQAAVLLTVKITDPAAVGHLLFTKYLIVVDLSAFLLTAGIIGAYHLGEKERLVHHRFLKEENNNA
jgi:NADH-quinone oxidoreductase subunit J